MGQSNSCSQGSRSNVKTYRSVSLQLIFVEIYERLLFNSVFHHFHYNSIYWVLVRFLTWWFLCITVALHRALNSVIFWFMFRSSSSLPRYFKACDQVWHPGLLFKLRPYGIECNLFKLLENYLHNWKQRVVLESVLTLEK